MLFFCFPTIKINLLFTLGVLSFMAGITLSTAQQAGTLDDFLQGNRGPNSNINIITPTPDGKFLLGGFFTTYTSNFSTYSRNRIARINADGSLDTTFNPGTGVGGFIQPRVDNLLSLQSGKILATGGIFTYDDNPVSEFLRINADGSYDPSFVPPQNAFGINAFRELSDQKLLIAGSFANLDGMGINSLARLNPNGSLDLTFNQGQSVIGNCLNPFGFPEPCAEINDLHVYPNGQILVAGSFQEFNGENRVGLARLNMDGSLDPGFSVALNAEANIRSLAVQTNGKILITGEFSSIGGVPRDKIARLNPDGSLDLSFDPGSEANFSDDLDEAFYFFEIDLFSDGRIFLQGNFEGFGGVPHPGGVLLNPDGSIDTNFDLSGSEENIRFDSPILLADGKVLVGLFGANFKDVKYNPLVRLLPNGSLDNSFLNIGGNPADFITLQKDEKILTIGMFSSYEGVPRNQLARVNPNGSLDESFVPPNDITPEIIREQSPGKLILSGKILEVEGVRVGSIVRLLDDGSIDPSFQSGYITRNKQPDPNDPIYEVLILPDSSILVGGFFTEYNGVSANSLVKLTRDGQIDNTFRTREMEAAFPGQVVEILQLVQQEDGKIIVGGNFTRYDGIDRKGYLRLNPDGSLDESFDVGEGPESDFFAFLNAIAIQPDGKILLGGLFNRFDGQTRFNLVRLNTDGSVDPTFNPGTSTGNGIITFPSAVQAFEVQPDGKILVGGGFSGYNGFDVNGIVRINPDGSFDESFISGEGAESDNFTGFVNTLKLQPNGRLFIGGGFNLYDKSACNGLVRVYSSVPAIPLNFQASEIQDSSFVLSWDQVASDITQYEIDISDDGFLNIIPAYRNLLINGTEVQVTGIAPGNIYACRVRAINEQGFSPNSEVIQVTLPPSVPNGLQARVLNQSQIVLSWDSNFDPGTLYFIQFSKESSAPEALVDLVSV